MSGTAVDELVEDYLTRLDRLAAGLPADRRRDLMEGIGEHISSARAGGAVDVDGVRAVLRRLGAPEEIVAAAAGDEPLSATRPTTATSPWGGLEVSAVVVLTAGGFLVPGLTALGGLVLAVSSPRWRGWEKSVAGVLCLSPLALLALFYVFEGSVPGLGGGNGLLHLIYVGSSLCAVAAGLFLGLRLRARTGEAGGAAR